MTNNSEKRAFWSKRYKHPDIIRHFKRRLFQLFNDECFRCGSTNRLQIDHHMPQARGGKTEPGNLVLLCWRCNNQKSNIEPDVFYGERHLARLAPLLQKQSDVLAFEWDWGRYNADAKGYFLSVGLEPEVVERVFGDPDYEHYLDREHEVHCVTAELDLDKFFAPRDD